MTTRDALSRAYRADEAKVLTPLADAAGLDAGAAAAVERRALELVAQARRTYRPSGEIADFLHEFGLQTREGIALMCLAEALLRIPDGATADRLINDKIGGLAWEDHLGKGAGLFVNASTWALMLTGKVITLDAQEASQPRAMLNRMVKRAGEPVIREAMRQGMRILGRQFVMGRTIVEALDRAAPDWPKGWRHSFDMLGEAARTPADAERYFHSYADAIAAIGARSAGRGPIDGPGISVKLSALEPRYEATHRGTAVPALVRRLTDLARAAKRAGIALCVDAEEAERLEISLDIIEAVAADPSLAGWDGFGLAIQAYQKRCRPLIDWLADLARRTGRKMPVRLVKGAYWDAEIKLAQERGFDGYPVFTRKIATDVSYLACARALLARRDLFYPQFATHNAHTIAYVQELAGSDGGFEFQRLHGMGDLLYAPVVSPKTPVRVYAPVGGHEDLLAYLVRRLLENGANSSFVNRLQDTSIPAERIVADPVAGWRALAEKPHPRIPLPVDLYRPDRANSRGLDLNDPGAVQPMLAEMAAALKKPWRAGAGGTTRPVLDPADRARVVGEVAEADEAAAARAAATAAAAWRPWNALGIARADRLERWADLIEADRAALFALLVREGGKTLGDAVAEVREAADFCRYYAARAREQVGPRRLPGPTGEENTLALSGRGVFLCISPWNFPLAIFTGQVAAALAAGNAVLAKPAPQTPLVAARAVELAHQAGIPPEVLQLLPGGPDLGAALVKDPRVAGLAFTGSTATGRVINRALAERDGPILPLIAETGGQNALIVDSTALPEQVVADTIDSAFRSAGQRCSAARVLFVADGIADKVLTMLAGAAGALVVGDPMDLATDVGPVIDEAAARRLNEHAERIAREGKLLFRLPLGPQHASGSFFAPMAVEIDRLDRLTGEVFGPVLHVIRYRPDRLSQVLDAIEATGYGLTLGIHSRIGRTADEIHRRLDIGNTYVNRNMIGAVVGVQPFGGSGLSGTGPKAGGPHYLARFGHEKTLTVNTAAAGGNAALLGLAGEG